MLKKIINRIIKQKDTVSWHKLSNVESEAENFELGISLIINADYIQ